MIEFLLRKEIERRVKKEMRATRYFSETVIIRVNQPTENITLDNSVYFLLN